MNALILRFTATSTLLYIHSRSGQCSLYRLSLQQVHFISRWHEGQTCWVGFLKDVNIKCLCYSIIICKWNSNKTGKKKLYDNLRLCYWKSRRYFCSKVQRSCVSHLQHFRYRHTYPSLLGWSPLLLYAQTINCRIYFVIVFIDTESRSLSCICSLKWPTSFFFWLSTN